MIGFGHGITVTTRASPERDGPEPRGLVVPRAGADREELFRTLLGILSAPGVLDVVVVEDIRWADEATLDLLRYLSRRPRGAAVLLIATYRDDGLAAPELYRLTGGNPFYVNACGPAWKRYPRRRGSAPGRARCWMSRR